MRKPMHMMWVMIAVFFVAGCGGDGASTLQDNNTNSTSFSVQSYQNKKLPVIKKDAIPEILLGNKTAPSKKVLKSFKDISEISKGFITLKEKAKFFYKKQLEMNIELGYMDSVWDQIENYCHEKQICHIPGGKILFTYTEALYKRDIGLIKEYEEKTGDIDSYSEYRNGLQNIIGTKLELDSATLTIDENAKYQYTLKSVQIGDQEQNSNIEQRSIVRWNDDNSSYLVREEIGGIVDGNSSEKPNWTQFEYTEKNGEKINIFINKDNFLGYDDEYLEFREKEDGSIYFIQNQPGNDISYHAEGTLSDEGGEMTFSDTEGYYLYETFDTEGKILTTISCIGAINDNQNISNTDICSIQDPDIIKAFMLKKIYSLGVPFYGNDDFSPAGSAEYHTMLRFDENDSMLAVVNCSTYVADYEVGEYGITFHNVKKTESSELKCLYPQIEKNFERVLEEGLPFMDAVDDFVKSNSHFNTAYGFWPNLDDQNRRDFNITKFYENLRSGEYVDSPLMNSVYKIKQAYSFKHTDTQKGYLLRTIPEVKVENKKILIDLIDATFDADIVVIDPIHIEFNNIHRVNKSNVTYPNDINLTCPEANVDTPDQCIEDPYFDNTNSDKVFADIIERFLNETIEVRLYSTGYEDMILSGKELMFTGTTRIP